MAHLTTLFSFFDYPICQEICHKFRFSPSWAVMSAQTLYDKLWQSHVVHTEQDGTALLYIDRHLLHEVTSPQAFEGLRLAGRKPWRIEANLAVADHNVPTTDRSQGIADPISRLQVETLDNNCADFGITEFKMGDVRQGIVHVIGPEQGATLPGMTAVCRVRIPARMAHSVRWPTASVPARSSMCSPRSACCRRNPKPCWSGWKALWAKALRPRK